MPVDITALRRTVERMEEQLRGEPEIATYDALVPRFHADLDDDHDELLARSAALMVIRELVNARRGPSPDP
jgi:hypothetical protein